MNLFADFLFPSSIDFISKPLCLGYPVDLTQRLKPQLNLWVNSHFKSCCMSHHCVIMHGPANLSTPLLCIFNA